MKEPDRKDWLNIASLLEDEAVYGLDLWSSDQKRGRKRGKDLNNLDQVFSYWLREKKNYFPVDLGSSLIVYSPS